MSILILLQLRPRITAEALASEFEVSVRTIHRDIDALSAAGVPVYGDRGPGGGFALHEGWRTRFDGVLADDARALPLVGLPAAARDLGLGGAPQRLSHKLLAALPGDAAALAGRLQQRLHVDPVDWYRERDPTPWLQPLAQAMLDDRAVEIDYQSWKGSRRWRAEPLGLVIKAGDWYAVVRSGARTMTLKVAAITALEVRDQGFERDCSFDLATWWAGAVERFERELRPEVAQLRASAEGCRRLREQGAYARRAVERGRSDAQPGWTRLALPIEDAEQAIRLVLSLSPEVELLAPAPLRAQLAQAAAALSRRHRRPVSGSPPG